MNTWSACFAVAVSAFVSFARGEAVEVTFAGEGGFELRGTLLFPEGDAPSTPGVLLLAGSGPTDRNGNQGALVTDTLKQIAEHLAGEGVASLRFDKRAVPAYAPDWPPMEELAAFFSYERFVGDAAHALEFLRSHERVDPERVGVLGHSEGGVIALSLASGENPPSVVFCLSTPGRPVAEVIREQLDTMIQRAPQLADRHEELMGKIDASFDAAAKGEPFPEGLEAWMAALFNATTTEIIRAYVEIDASELAARARGPLLVLQGSRDGQVSPERDAQALIAALQSREEGASKLVVVQDASHNLKPTTGPGDPGIAGELAPGALRAISGWAAEWLLRSP